MKKVVKIFYNKFFRCYLNKNFENKMKDIGWETISESSEDDVFIVGYPKSGNTWMQNLLVNIYHKIDTRNVPDKLIQELVPDVHAKRFYKAFYKPTFFKSHSLPQKKYRKVIYIVRDGRDVMVSFYHFLKNLTGKEPSLHELINGVQASFKVAWHEHVEQYLSNPFNSEIIFIKYESLINQDLDELKKICSFLGIERDDEFLKNVYLNNTFKEMKDREKKFGWNNPAWPKGKSFIRRGQVGSYKDELPHILLEKFLEKSKITLNKLKYHD